MPLFRYRVRDKEGQVVSGTLEGTDINTVVEKLDTLGYVPITIKEDKAGGAGDINIDLSKYFERVKPVDLINFTRQFVTLHRAGLPMLSAIGALQAQTRSKPLSRALDAIRKDLMGGAALSAALSKFPRVFNDLYVNSIWAGETGGVLDEILERLVMLLEHERKLRSDVSSAMRYPIILMVGFVIVIIVLTAFVLPTFTELLASTGGTMPLPTRILMMVTDFMSAYWYVLFLLAAGAGVLFYLFVRTTAGRLWWDRLKIRIPIFGPILYKMALSRFARMFETLDRTGLPILRSLSLVSKTVGNAYIGSTVEKIAESVRRGRGLSAPMREVGVFPPMVVQMVATGEESGALDDMLKQVSDYYDSEVEYAVKNLTGMIEPVMILLMGVMAVFLIIAIIMPYMEILTSFGAGGGYGTN
ncbi:MAG TPA: type II secretion system F family protein [candidate division WOR-3 bacterium]|uniref:Type II secretion system F family protein n=1 Tax=candidate division WOR-3 bacterium TaxID=2052148 RepID=A0A7V0XFU7_UNCW3|nr:type II secretion system F family protein [candidate division WOR-3 bacterium]